MSTIFLCVGSTKSGTSWLYRELSKHPDTHLRTVKELHYFDSYDLGWRDERLHRMIKALRGDIVLAAARGDDIDPGLMTRILDRSEWVDILSRRKPDVATWLAYLRNGGDGAQVIGEATPSYALLSEERLREIAGAAPDVRVVYLMRDPLARLWSHVRLMASRREADRSVTPERANRILTRTLKGKEPDIAMRGDYASALTKLRAVVSPEKLHLAVFEDMVSGDGFDRICRFLGLAPQAADPGQENPGQETPMSEDLRARALAWLAPHYQAVERELGTLPESWTRP